MHVCNLFCFFVAMQKEHPMNVVETTSSWKSETKSDRDSASATYTGTYYMHQSL